MPKLKNGLPRMCKDRNQALSWYKGKRYYHGVWGSPEAKKNFDRFITKLLENPSLLLQVDGAGEVLVSELAAGFLSYVEPRLDRAEFLHFKRAVRYLVEFYGEFAPQHPGDSSSSRVIWYWSGFKLVFWRSPSAIKPANNSVVVFFIGKIRGFSQLFRKESSCSERSVFFSSKSRISRKDFSTT